MNRNITVLYIDDDLINLELFTIVFSEHFNVITGESGYAGLKLLDETPNITIVISDMKMPGMNGIEFILEAKKRHVNKKYFLLTGYGINNDIRKAMDNGIVLNCFSKPFDQELIENAILTSV